MIKLIRNILMATTAPDREEKVKNAIAFFALEHERLTQKLIAVSSLHKYLTLLDHASSKKSDIQLLDFLIVQEGECSPILQKWEMRPRRIALCLFLRKANTS
jgi:hypothetical protein